MICDDDIKNTNKAEYKVSQGKQMPNKRKGQRSEPWGTPRISRAQAETLSPIKTGICQGLMETPNA